VTEGHLLLTPHQHVAIWSELHASEQAASIGAIEEAETLLNERFAPDGFNVGFNQGAAASQNIDHFHIHVIPRRAGDVTDPRGGVRHVIPEKGNYLAGAGQEEGRGLSGRRGPSFSQ
jgi:diadenosine tetraphosphate (Ap4A) HIT family hydrolase